MEAILYSKEEDIGIIKLNRPEVYNIVNETLIREMDELLDEIKEDQDIKAVVITSNSDKAFCTGIDLKDAAKLAPEETKKILELGQALCRKIEELSKPVVAAINALALGGGLEMSLACNDRIIVEGAKVGAVETSIGVLPAWGGTQRLPRIVGKGIAAEMIFTGEQINARQALEFGLVSKIVPSTDGLIPTAIETVKLLINKEE
ncbi:MAG: enoyl-CoA hydratase/isomerase family protein [Candidatus Hermodarchaeota archaeon]